VVRPDTIALLSDASEYARTLAEGLREASARVREFERSDQLAEFLDDSFSAVVIVSPHVHQARAARNTMRDIGGSASHIPLLAALRDIELSAETETLRFFDDFIVRPGGAAELLARVRVLMVRRSKEGNLIEVGDLTVNLDAHRVVCGGKHVDLTYKEFELLKMLASTPGRAYTRDELLKSIWGYDYYGGTRTVDVHVRRLRAKIEGEAQYIETVHGVGYRFIPA
jgi:DNA-binding response OmpR family regulator